MRSYKRCSCEGGHKAERIIDLHPATAKQLKIASVSSKAKILMLLMKTPHCVCDLMAHTKLSQTLVSHHLSNLNEAGLVQSEKSGAFVDYSLTEKGRKLVKAIAALNP